MDYRLIVNCNQQKMHPYAMVNIGMTFNTAVNQAFLCLGCLSFPVQL